MNLERKNIELIELSRTSLFYFHLCRKTSICHSMTSIFRASKMSNKNEDYDHFCGDTVNDVQDI